MPKPKPPKTNKQLRRERKRYTKQKRAERMLTLDDLSTLPNK